MGSLLPPDPVWSPSEAFVWWWTCKKKKKALTCICATLASSKSLYGRLRPTLLITALLRSDARTIDGFTPAVKTQSSSPDQSSATPLTLSPHFPLCLHFVLMISLSCISLSCVANCWSPAVTGLIITGSIYSTDYSRCIAGNSLLLKREKKSIKVFLLGGLSSSVML